MENLFIFFAGFPDCFQVSSSGQFAGLRCYCHPFPEPPFLAKVGALQFSASALVGIRSTTSGFQPMQTRRRENPTHTRDFFFFQLLEK
ncbi:hypothetical protein DVH24_038120 [Malus domestica]|uniref:Uncharacterized protein n=1 Tax=Malus domestica TaxID=3750 RepID=A0A498K8Y9_MALDO|nr:hypothetical protein DVH24_038120 [Malus domestica]